MSAKEEKTPIGKAESDKHKLGDLKLQPWTPQRIIKAQALGLKYPNLGRDGWARFKETDIYPGAVRDVIIFFYLSTLESKEAEDATYEDAQSWAIKRKLHDVRSKAFWYAFGKFLDVQGEVRKATTTPVASGEEEQDPND